MTALVKLIVLFFVFVYLIFLLPRKLFAMVTMYVSVGQSTKERQ